MTTIESILESVALNSKSIFVMLELLVGTPAQSLKPCISISHVAKLVSSVIIGVAAIVIVSKNDISHPLLISVILSTIGALLLSVGSNVVIIESPVKVSFCIFHV